MTQTARVLSAVQRGARDAKAIARMAKIPKTHIHPLLNRLRARGVVQGFTGSLRAVKPKKGKGR